MTGIVVLQVDAMAGMVVTVMEMKTVVRKDDADAADNAEKAAAAQKAATAQKDAADRMEWMECSNENRNDWKQK